MELAKNTSVRRLHVHGRYESLRRTLQSDSHRNHLDKPLAYWALPTDRRLPLALLDRTLGELLSTPFEDISGTPGVGEKKIGSLVELLARAADTEHSEILTHPTANPTGDSLSRRGATPSNGFDPATVSEIVWARWRRTVVERGLESEPLGRFAPSLKNMTRVIWTRPLSAYTQLTLAEIRRKKTHGRKRLRAILEVFHSIHQMVAGMGSRDELVVRVVPRLIDAAETWTGRTLQTAGLPGGVEIFERFITPLLGQIRIDASRQVVDVAELRLGIAGPITSVRRAAHEAGLTRARVYQLLNEINDIMNVRWPLGRHQAHELRAKFLAQAAEMDSPLDVEQFLAAVEVFYPGTRRGAAGPVQPAAPAAEGA